MRIAITKRYANQIGPDSWEMCATTKIFNVDSPIRDIFTLMDVDDISGLIFSMVKEAGDG